MNEYRYILQSYKGMKTRFRCEQCQHKDKTFARYVDTETGEHLHPTVGRCNRESSCGYHYTPKQYFKDNNISFDVPKPKSYQRKAIAPKATPVSYIPMDMLKASLKGYETNHFVTYLISLFGKDVTSQLISKYFIGTSKYWDGATVFWQIDEKHKIRTGKIMQYNPNTGKRVKEPHNCITWVHAALKLADYNLKQCLFGQHLLIDTTKPIAIVESEKTAIIASVYLPQFVWVAVGSLTNLNEEKCNVLKGRNVVLFPDLKAFDKWNDKARELSHITSFVVSDLLERKAPEADKLKGYDLADYLIKFDYRNFTETKQTPTVEELLFAAFEDKVKVLDTKAPPPYVIFNYEGQIFKIANKQSFT